MGRITTRDGTPRRQGAITAIYNTHIEAEDQRIGGMRL
jgi:hypothetical protein